MIFLTSVMIGGFTAVVSYLQYPASLWHGVGITLPGIVAMSLGAAFLPIPELAAPALGLLMIGLALGLVAVLATAALRRWFPIRQVVPIVGLSLGGVSYLLLIWALVRAVSGLTSETGRVLDLPRVRAKGAPRGVSRAAGSVGTGAEGRRATGHPPLGDATSDMRGRRA